jgi:hypothetical protein
MKIKLLVEQLVEKHNFDLSYPGRALWVGKPGLEDTGLGDLVVCVCPQLNRYIVGRALSDRPGFSVYYSKSWEPKWAFNDDGSPLKDLAGADEQMCVLVERFLPSTKAQVTELDGELWWEDWFTSLER